jgi:PilZ domain
VLMFERRGAPRYPIALVAELTISGTEITLNGRTPDISRSGGYVDSSRSFAAGTRFVLKLFRGKEIFEARAAVVYVSQDLGMGVAFEAPMLGGQLEILERFISKAVRKFIELAR